MRKINLLIVFVLILFITQNVKASSFTEVACSSSYRDIIKCGQEGDTDISCDMNITALDLGGSYNEGDSTLIESDGKYLFVDIGIGALEEKGKSGIIWDYSPISLSSAMYYNNVINKIEELISSGKITKTGKELSFYFSHYHSDHLGTVYKFSDSGNQYVFSVSAYLIIRYHDYISDIWIPNDDAILNPLNNSKCKTEINNFVNNYMSTALWTPFWSIHNANATSYSNFTKNYSSLYKNCYMHNSQDLTIRIPSGDLSYYKWILDSYQLDYYAILKNVSKKYGIKAHELNKGKCFTFGDVFANVVDRYNKGIHAFPNSYDQNYSADVSAHYSSRLQNDSSPVTIFKAGNTKYLNSGDLTINAEQTITADISADIFKFNHHGGQGSNGADYLKNINKSASYASYAYFQFNKQEKNSDGSVRCASDIEYSKYGACDWVIADDYMTPDGMDYYKYRFNTSSSRYNGDITYNVQNDVITPKIARKKKTVTVEYYDKHTSKLIGKRTLDFNNSSPIFIRKRDLYYNREVLKNGKKYLKKCSFVSSVADINNNITSSTTLKYTVDCREVVTPPTTQCSNKTYNGSPQVITIANKPEYTFSNNKYTNAGTYDTSLNLTDAYKWKDDSILNIGEKCKITKKSIIVKANNQEIRFGSDISKTSNQATSTGLVSGHSIKSVSLVKSTSDITTSGKITPSSAKIVDSNGNDVTNNYEIKYDVGNLKIDVDYSKYGNFKLKNNLLINSPQNMSVSNINFGLNSSYKTMIYNSKNTLKSSGLLSTGDRIKIYLNNSLVREYITSIRGDVTGDGKVSFIDVTKLYKYYKGKITMDSEFIEAGNAISTDNVITFNDIVKIYRYTKNKVSTLD